MIAQDAGQRIRSAVPIADVVSQYIRLRKNGPDSLLGLCPFHQEKTPSFVVHPRAGYFKCFGCHIAGDVMSFLMRIEGKPFGKVAGELAEQYGVQIEGFESRKKQAQKRKLAEVLGAEARWFWREFRYKQWKRYRAAHRQVLKLMEWGWTRDVEGEMLESIEATWEACELEMLDSMALLQMAWDATGKELLERYLKVRTPGLSLEIQKRIAADPLNKLVKQYGRV